MGIHVCLHNFFHDMDLGFFYALLSRVFDDTVTRGSPQESQILLESIFGTTTRLYEKPWRATFLFVGESDRNIQHWRRNHRLQDYSCVLKGEPDRERIVNVPLFVLYSYCYGFTERFVFSPERIRNPRLHACTRIPPKDVCVIVSNGTNQEGRNAFFDQLERRNIRVDYAGAYKNNVPRVPYPICSPHFVSFVSQYKFIVSMENSRNATYITEKILHGFAANTIPIYWGSDHVGDYFNEARFIWVKSWDPVVVDAAIERMVALANDPEAYLEVINQPIYKDNRVPFPMDVLAEKIKTVLL